LSNLSLEALPRPPVGHDGWSQALAMDGSIYFFGAVGTGRVNVNKYEPETRRWLTLPNCWGDRFEQCYLAFLTGEPSASLPVRDEADVYYPVIQEVQHPDEPAEAIDPAEAAVVVAEQWTQRVQLNLGASSSRGSDDPGLLLSLMLLDFSRHPMEFQKALLEGPELASCREQMRGHPCRLDSGTFVFVEPFQYNIAIEAAMRHRERLTAHHVITSERFEPDVMRAVNGLRSRLDVRVKQRMTIYEPLQVEEVRTFLDVPARALRSIASVTHSTTDAHGGRNHRTVGAADVL